MRPVPSPFFLAALLAGLTGTAAATEPRVPPGDRLPAATRVAPPEGAPPHVPGGPGGRGQVHTAPGLTLPASFTGTTPMASGPGMAWHLDLWPDQVFHLSQTDGDTGSTGDIGRWHADPDRGAIVLRGGREGPVFLEILGTGDLRLMDLSGTPIDSDLPYTLAAGPLAPAEVALFLTGMVDHAAEVAMFTACATGHSYPIAAQGDYPAAARALAGLGRYSSHNGGDPAPAVLAVLEGRLALRPDSEGGERPHLVIDRFDRFELFLTCDSFRPQAEAVAPDLTNTYWQITTVLGAEVTPAEARREPHLILRTGTPPAFEATLGCNRIGGGYAITGDTLSASRIAMTRMACTPELDALEGTLVQGLGQVVRWQIDGPALVLFAADGAPVLTARAVYLP